jgi:hypothetical protein
MKTNHNLKYASSAFISETGHLIVFYRDLDGNVAIGAASPGIDYFDRLHSLYTSQKLSLSDFHVIWRPNADRKAFWQAFIDCLEKCEKIELEADYDEQDAWEEHLYSLYAL